MTDHQPAAPPSVRVHRVFNRLGIVLAGAALIVAAVLGAAGVYSYATGNQTGAQFGLGSMVWLGIIAIAVYAFSRAIGWIIAGAMKY